MRVFSHSQAKMKTKKKLEDAYLTKVEHVKKHKVQFEKGDILALTIAALFNFVLPIMLVLGLICVFVYYFFLLI